MEDRVTELRAEVVRAAIALAGTMRVLRIPLADGIAVEETLAFELEARFPEVYSDIEYIEQTLSALALEGGLP